MIKKSITLLIVSLLVTLTACNFDMNNSTTKSNLDGATPVQDDKVVKSEDNNGSNKSNEDKSTTKQKVALYFLNSDYSALVQEVRSIEISEMAVLRATVEALIEGPRQAELRETLPKGVSILGIKRDGNIAVVDFSKEYKIKESNVSEELKRISVVNTLTAISGIEKVKILVEGHELLDSNGKAFGEMARVNIDKNGSASAQ